MIFSTQAKHLQTNWAKSCGALGSGCTIQQRKQEGRQAGRKGRQGLGKADTPSNKGTGVGRQLETSEKGLREGGHTIQQRQTRKKTSWEKSSNTLAGRMEAEPWEGRRTIQQRDVKLGDKLGDELGDKLGNKLGDKLGDKADKASGHHATKESKN